MKVQYVNREGMYEFHGPFGVQTKLPAGIYNVRQNDVGVLFLESEHLETERLVNLPNSPTSDIMNKIDHFLSPEVMKAFDKYGMLYKRGILLYGPPGTGKTTVVNQLIRLVVQKKDMIVLLGAHPSWVKAIVKSIREIEKVSRPVLVVWEEFETMVHNSEGALLSLLDGVSQVNNIIYLATTNYLERIPPRIKNRPSRFADVVEIGYPSAQVREKFLKSKIHKDDKVDVKLWVEKTEGLSIDHLKDLIISVLVLEVPFDEAVEKMRGFVHEEEEYDDESEDQEREWMGGAETPPRSKVMPVAVSSGKSLLSRLRKK